MERSKKFVILSVFICILLNLFFMLAWIKSTHKYKSETFIFKILKKNDYAYSPQYTSLLVQNDNSDTFNILGMSKKEVKNIIIGKYYSFRVIKYANSNNLYFININ